MKTKKRKNILLAGLLALFLCLFMDALHRYQTLIAIGHYRDVGIHELLPYGVFPVEVKNKTIFHRTFPYRSAYFVYYSALDDARLECRMEVSSQATGKKIVQEQKSIKRRLLISDKGESIALLPNQTQIAYLAEHKKKEGWIMAGTGSCIAMLTIAFAVQWKKKQRNAKKF